MSPGHVTPRKFPSLELRASDERGSIPCLCRGGAVGYIVTMNIRTLIAIALLGAVAPAAAEPVEAALDRICYHHVQPGTPVADRAVDCSTAMWPAEPRCADPRLREHGEVRAWRAVLHEERRELVVHLAVEGGCHEEAQS